MNVNALNTYIDTNKVYILITIWCRHVLVVDLMNCCIKTNVYIEIVVMTNETTSLNNSNQNTELCFCLF